ncbi:MAG: cysteine desulfurase family protein [Candidatus Parcubacteria bacterium]|nr:cysteine desulfurase family protein [Candidatus Parcubacteria bacterium]
MSSSKSKCIYLDHSATTPLDKRVLSVVQKISSEIYGNPSSLHKEGVEAKKALLEIRKDIAEAIGANPDEIIFTSGGTESNNLALFGVVQDPKKFHLIVSSIEHASVLECARELEKRGAEVTYLPVDSDGLVSPKDVKEAIKENTVLVSVMYANNEIGTIQPIAEIAKVIRHSKSKPIFHTDACQAVNYLDMNVLRLGVDLMTFNASKIYGPKGVGALFVKRGVKISPILFGGGQEKGARSGTENVAGLKGFAEAMRITEEMKEKESARLLKLRDFFIAEILKKIPGTVLNGSAEKRLPNNVNISIPGTDAEALVIQLDARGISCSTGSACANISHDGKVSHVIEALGFGRNRSASSLRFTLGRDTKKEDLFCTVNELSKILKITR